MPKRKKKADERTSTDRRLDALIRLSIEHNRKPGSVLKEGEYVRLLNSAGLTPTEIANILGKKSATDVAPHLYQKKK
jgi:hypothetical protein